MPSYNFTIEMTSIGKGYVEADSLEEAKAKIKRGDWEDIYDEVDTQCGDLIEIYED